ncbi:hypothetical protein OIU79_017844 [Salix purpurea]|uniref:Uncharacterized protein n=1 Tax=Salix purpurea TaxID=77065 RepID=A0A9Q1AK97_SALPP|nr:hypothetical protein OIU79_017844 [Salix purpurea]
MEAGAVGAAATQQTNKHKNEKRWRLGPWGLQPREMEAGAVGAAAEGDGGKIAMGEGRRREVAEREGGWRWRREGGGLEVRGTSGGGGGRRLGPGERDGGDREAKK